MKTKWIQTQLVGEDLEVPISSEIYKNPEFQTVN